MKYWSIENNEAILNRKVEITGGHKSLYSYKLNNRSTKFILKNDIYITDKERQELLSIL